MRIYKDLDMVEQLGSGIPRILEHYGKDTFHFTENFLRMNFFASEQVTPQVTPQVLMFLKVFTGEHSRQELQDKMELSDRKNFRENYLQKAIEQNLIELTIPDKPRSSKQKYRLTQKGKMYQSK